MSEGEKKFKIISSRDYPCSVQHVPFWHAEQFNRQALSNHGQTIECLNGRGGLDPREFYMVANGLDYFRNRHISIETCIKWLEDQFGLLAKVKELECTIEILKKERGHFETCYNGLKPCIS